MNDLSRQLQHQLLNLEQDGLLRKLVPLVQTGTGHVTVSGRSCLNLSGNDYLVIGSNQELVEQFS